MIKHKILSCMCHPYFCISYSCSTWRWESFFAPKESIASTREHYRNETLPCTSVWLRNSAIPTFPQQRRTAAECKEQARGEGDTLHTHNSALEVLYPPLAHPVHEPPGPGGRVLPQVAHGQVGVVADPGLLHVIGHAHQGEPGTAIRGHLVGLVPAVLDGLRWGQNREGLEPWEWQRKRATLPVTDTLLPVSPQELAQRLGQGTHPSLCSDFQCGNTFHLPLAQILTLLINASIDGSKVKKMDRQALSWFSMA